MKNKNFFERMKMDIDDLSYYYMVKRKEKFDKGVPLRGINIRKLIHFIPLSLIKIDKRLEHEKITVINDERTKYKWYDKNKRPIIFACGHFGGNDIHRVFETLKAPAYLLFGDPVGTYKDIVGFILVLNGAINLETRNKTDRRIAKQRSIELLSKNGNLLIFPEGAWNLSPNLLTMKLYKGTAEMAKETGCDIVPIAVEELNKNYIVSIGKTISKEEYENLSVYELNDLIRDRISTEKYRIIEKNKISRKNMPEIDVKDFEKYIVNKCGYGYTVEDVYETKFVDKDITLQEDAFKHLDDIEPNINNAFLFSKRNHH